MASSSFTFHLGGWKGLAAAVLCPAVAGVLQSDGFLVAVAAGAEQTVVTIGFDSGSVAGVVSHC